ncbi:MAG: DUF1294 domain-containing protein [Ruthenibacterium sp.]
MNVTMQVGLWFLAGINALSFVLFGADKFRAQREMWRIPERTLFLLAALGGSAGAVAGIWTFRHKTRHLSFVVGMPAILLAQVALGVWLHMKYVALTL